MLKKFAKLALMSTALMLSSVGAHADKAKLKEFIFDVKSAWTTLHVTSSDGEKWDKLKPGNVKFWAHMKLDTKWPGKVDQVAVVLGKCTGAACKSFPLLWSENVNQRDYNHQRNFSVPTGLITDTTPGLALKGQQIIEKCNQNLTAAGATKSNSFQHVFETTFVAGTTKRDLGKIGPAQAYDEFPFFPVDIDHSKSGEFTVNVVCDPYVQRTAEDLKFDPGEFKVKDIKLFLSTYSNAITKPNSATTCKKGQIKVRLTASKAGPAKFKLWTKIGNSAMTSKVIDAWASFDGNSGYEAEYVEWVSVKTTFMQVKAEEMVSAFGKSTPWEDITLYCKSGGGLASDTSTQDEPLLPPAKYDGKLTIANAPNAKRDRCPRQGQVAFQINSSSGTPVSYRLDESNGQSWTGTLQMFPSPFGPAKYRGVGVKTFDVSKTGNITFALKRVKDNKAYVLDFRAKQFICKTLAVNTGSDNLVQDTNRDEPAIPPAKYDGKLTIANAPNAKRYQCPRQGQVAFRINSSSGTPVSYLLDGSDGQSWTGILQMFPSPFGPAKYRGVGVKTFDVSKTGNVTFALKRVKGGKAYVLDFRAKQFICKTPAVETGANDIKVAPRPNTGETRVPATLVPNAVDKAKADAARRRLEAAKKTAEAKRKREAAAAKALKVKVARDAAIAKRKADAARARKLKAARDAAIAKRKRDAWKKAAALLKFQKLTANGTAIAKRKAGAAANRRAAPSSVGAATQRRVIRRR